MQSNHHHRETAVSFHKSGGHSHDGTNSTRIDFSSYSDADLAPLVAKITKKIKAGGNDNDSERLSVETQPTDDLIPTGAPLIVTLTSGYNDASSGWGDNTGWIKATWTVYEAPGDMTGDDDADDLLPVGYMEGNGTTAVDDTDQTDILVEEVQSAEAINEYQVSYWNIAFESGGHVATPEHKKFIRTDEREILIAPVPLGKTFHVRVRGISGNGKHSDPASNDTSSHILTGGGGFSETPSAPTGLDAVSMGPDSIMLTWDESTHPLVVNGGNYRVQCNTSNNFTTPLYARTVGGESTTFTGLSQGTQYWFRVKAKTSTGVLSNWSSTLGPETTTSLGPGDISDGNAPGSSPTPTIKGGPNYLYVKWPQISNADPVFYNIHIGTTSGLATLNKNDDPGTGLCVASTYGTSAFITTLANGTALSYGTTYYIKIVACDTDGRADPGSQASGTMVKIDGGVDITANTVTANEIAANAITASELAALNMEVGKYIKSTSYSAGISGWAINADGTAEFGNITARGTIKTGGTTSSDPYIKLDVTSGDGRVDIFPGKDYSGGSTPYPATLIGGSGTSLSGAVSGTKQVWTYISSPYFSGGSYSSRPVFLEMMTDNDTSTKSHFFVHAQKMWDDARHEGLVSSYASHSFNRTSSGYSEQGPITIDPVATTDPWGMDISSGYILIPRTGTYLVTYTMEFGIGTTASSIDQGSRGLREIKIKKFNSDTTTVDKTYVLDRKVLSTVSLDSGVHWGYESGAMSGTIAVDATADQVLKFYVVNWMEDESSGTITGKSNISVYRIDA